MSHASFAAGAVGITLTAASRVYLMEPCIDPATEVQAAGRIHRLGQTKDVLIKRFAFRDSLDENIIKLHERMRRAATDVVVTDGCIPGLGVRILNGEEVDSGSTNKKARKK